jgi:hypothetical protein
MMMIRPTRNSCCENVVVSDPREPFGKDRDA